MEKTAPEDAGYRVGDILRVTCPWVVAEVVAVSRSYASLAWPWAEIDPDSRFAWNGQVAFSTDPDSPERWQDVFRTNPEPWQLSAGDTCLVGVPETLVRVLGVDRHDPPADRGWLPRPRTTLVVAHLDQPEEPMWAEEEGEGFIIAPGSFAPLTLEFVSRG